MLLGLLHHAASAVMLQKAHELIHDRALLDAADKHINGASNGERSAEHNCAFVVLL